MKAPILAMVTYALGSIFAASASPTKLSGEFVKCSNQADSRADSVLLLHLAAWPESLSHFTEIDTMTSREMKEAASTLSEELLNFSHQFSALVNLNQKACPSIDLVSQMHHKFIVVSSLQHELLVVAELLALNQEAQRAASKLQRQVRHYKEIRESRHEP